MGYKLVIAEKPSVAQSLAAVIGAATRKDGYLEGNGWRVSWCVGHLAGLADADSYDPKYAKWRYEDSKSDTMRWQFRLPAYSCDFESTMITLTDWREYGLWKSSLHEKKLLKS